MIPPIPAQMAEFIEAHHVLNLACYGNQTLWCASCFYAFDRELARLIILTKSTTKHGQLMLDNPTIVGTIAGQPEQLNEIEGIQFEAYAVRLEKENDRASALERYYQRHHLARLIPHNEVWELRLNSLKFTTNKKLFAQKTIWQRTA